MMWDRLPAFVLGVWIGLHIALIWALVVWELDSNTCEKAHNVSECTRNPVTFTPETKGSDNE